MLATKLFPGGVLVGAGNDHLLDAMRMTRELVNNSEVPAIFEATFAWDGVLVRVDVLRRHKRDEFKIIEVKSSTAVKLCHLFDLSIQQYVLRGAGIPVKSNHVMHVNPDYVFNGDLELSKLFLIDEIQSDRLLSRSAVSAILNDQYTMLSQPEPPNIEPGSFCKNPYRCEFFDHCHPAKYQDDVRSLPLPAGKIHILLQQGLTSLSELPPATCLTKYLHLTDRERLIVDAARYARTHGLWTDARLQKILSAIKYPVCFMDFETVAPAIPRFVGTRPYQAIPVQFSVHRRRDNCANLESSAFLWSDGDDPRRAFIEGLYESVADAATILVYGSFEGGVLSNLARLVPEYASKIGSIRSKLVDLLSIIRRNVYSPAFLGSYSIKRVLPALVPGMSYDDLAVRSGDQVASIWAQLYADDVGTVEKARLRTALLEYCERDTLALANLVDVLQRHAGPHNS